MAVRGVTGVDDCTPCAEWNNALVAAAVANSPDIPEFPAACYTAQYTDVLIGGPGLDGFALPDEVGFRFGNASGGFTSLMLNTHYNNPNGDAGVIDSSGARLYFTEELRAMDMGTVLLGDPQLALVGTPVSDGKTSFSFGCPSSCTEEHFEVWIMRHAVSFSLH